ncbi:MAG TPA: CHASE2 domain-containing protein [Pyrinomonadaceae bacterium]|nr:CHASE2 domain-containing protein [Pyrinomonadaceae bacterium]
MQQRGNYITDSTDKRRRISRSAWLIAIVLASMAAGMMCVWLAPGLDAYARDVLMRSRGPVAPPDEIVIVAIDEASIARFGRFPWSRDLTARAVETIASAQPKVIALDVLYSEPSTDANDAALAASIERAGNVVVAAQLVDAADKKDERLVQWLRPLPAIEGVAAGVGHVNILTEADGAARELPLRKSDNEGRALWSLAVETIRVGDGLRELEVQDIPGAVHLGRRKLLLANDEASLRFAPSEANTQVVNLRADRMVIDYIGPGGSFAPRTLSFADVLDGKVAAEKLKGKYVLVGATAATLGDHVASPFVHLEGADRNQHGVLMPGVEVLANAINTIVRERFYRETPDWLAALCAALAAAALIFALTITQGRFETLKQLCALGGLVIALLALSYLAFTRWLIIPPVVPALVSLATAAPLLLLSRSLATSADLDERIAELSSADRWLTPQAQVKVSEHNLRSSPAEMIARLLEAESVAIFARPTGTSHDYHLIAAYGRATVSSLSKEEILQATPLGMEISSASHSMTLDAQTQTPDKSRGSLFSGPDDEHQNHSRRTLTLRVGKPEDPAGALLISYQVTREPHSELLRLCLELTASYVARMAGEALEAETERVRSLSSAGWRLPRGVEWKARALGLLHHRLMARARFIDRALRSIEDGLLAADIDGRILFANPRAAEIFGVTEHALIESNLFQRINEDEDGASQNNQSWFRRAERETLVRLVVERLPVEREIALGDAPVRYYMLRLSAVSDEEDGTVLGLVASLSDVTKQRELQQTKDDVMMLVTHELRTPLTAIQGMSEVLSQYDVEHERRREMHLAINEEARRLARMINDYLDITRLESGARPLRLAPARIAPLVERALLMLDPLAQQQEKRIVRRFAPNLPPLLVDGDLLAQAVTNLVANAIKYGKPASEIVVELRAERDALRIEVADQGHGIPAESQSRIFEKFYRVLRLEDADVSGTGLGLAFVREIAEKHGGRVTVESEEGVGSIFSLRLPLSFKGE